MGRVEFKVDSKGLTKLLADLHANAKGFEGILRGVPVEVWPVFSIEDGVLDNVFKVSIPKGLWYSLCKKIEYNDVAGRYRDGE